MWLSTGIGIKGFLVPCEKGSLFEKYVNTFPQKGIFIEGTKCTWALSLILTEKGFISSISFILCQTVIIKDKIAKWLRRKGHFIKLEATTTIIDQTWISNTHPECHSMTFCIYMLRFATQTLTLKRDNYLYKIYP